MDFLNIAINRFTILAWSVNICKNIIKKRYSFKE